MSNTTAGRQRAVPSIRPSPVSCRLRFPAFSKRHMPFPLSNRFIFTLAQVIRIGGLLFLLAALAACAELSAVKDFSAPTGLEERLYDQLAIAEAALAAGQVSVSRDLYISLRQRFKSFPEPYVALGNIALYTSDLASAKRHFRQGLELASSSPAMRARAEFGLGRVSLAEANSKKARAHFKRASRIPELAKDANFAPWIENGLAVSATLLGEYEQADENFQDALITSKEHPAIVANYVRMLQMSGNIDEARKLYGAKPTLFWLKGDTEELKTLTESHFQTGFIRSQWKPTPLVRRTQSKEHEQRLNGVPRISFGKRGNELVAGSGSTFQQLILRSKTLSELPKDEAESREPAQLTVYWGQSKQVELERNATTVIVVSPGIADVRLVSPKILYIVGKGIGRTSVALFDNDTRIEDWIVSVTADLHPLRKALANEEAFANVQVEQVLRSVELSGEVDSPALAERVLRLAEGALPDGTMITE